MVSKYYTNFLRQLSDKEIYLSLFGKEEDNALAHKPTIAKAQIS